MAKLFTPLQLGPLTLKNRIIIAPMCTYTATDGIVQPWHEQHYATLAQSNAGLLIIEASAVAPEGRISYADAGIWNEACQQAWGNVIEHVSRYTHTPMIMQLGHAGRKASHDVPWNGGASITPDAELGWQTVAPSAIGFAESDPQPQALTKEAIAQVIEQFVEGAKRAQAAGFKGVEIHGAHGYLIHQFLSPLSNQRRDEFGGSLENRMRLALAIFDAIKAAIPTDFMIGIRISATDWAAGGWDIEQSIELVKALDARHCDYVHVSTGGLTEHQQIQPQANYQVPFAQRIKAEVNMPVITVGLITDAHQAEAILTEEKADAIGLGRGILYDPRWPWHAAAKLGATIQIAPQYLRCQPHGLKRLFVK